MTHPTLHRYIGPFCQRILLRSALCSLCPKETNKLKASQTITRSFSQEILRPSSGTSSGRYMPCELDRLAPTHLLWLNCAKTTRTPADSIQSGQSHSPHRYRQHLEQVLIQISRNMVVGCHRGYRDPQGFFFSSIPLGWSMSCTHLTYTDVHTACAAYKQ